MQFNSLQFLIFLPLVFGAYWAANRHLRLQNLLIVLASYVFYGWWDWRFLMLIAFTSGWAYLFGLLPRSKWNVAISLIINLGILGFFKYYNFFVDSLVALVPGLSESVWTLKIVLPVGISFYTFQALSYTIDVYRGSIVPTKDLIAFFAFISFFPQLVAGPIERATNLLPQFLKARRFDYPLAVEGCRQMLWGFAKKVLVADNCALAANTILKHADMTTIPAWEGMVCFAFQIYCDFSGYSDIAIGCSKLFGIRLMKNFDHPYFARDIAEFWRRWHISLTTWFRDYLYIPLGGSRCGKLKKIRNTFVIFLVSGLWHGANWTFLFWGFVHAVFFIPLLLLGKNRKHVGNVAAEGRLLPTPREIVQMVVTFLLVVIGWTFFRAENISQAFAWLDKMLLQVDFAVQKGGGLALGFKGLLFATVLLIIEWFNRDRAIPRLLRNAVLRFFTYCLLAWCIFFWCPEAQTFIYFQF